MLHEFFCFISRNLAKSFAKTAKRQAYLLFTIIFPILAKFHINKKTADSANLFVKGQKQLGSGLVSAIDAHMIAKWRLDLLPNSRLLQMEA
jgi:hypothetical protein